MWIRRRSCLALGIACLAPSPVRLDAQTTSDLQYQQLLPGDLVRPAGQGLALLADPFNSGALLLGSWNWSGSAWTHTINRLTPTDAGWTRFNVEGLDEGLVEVRKLGCNPKDRLYAAGHIQLVTGGSPKNPSMVNQWRVRSSVSGAAGTWGDEDTFGFSVATGKGKSAPQWSRAYGMTADSNGLSAGNVYICGIASDGVSWHWVIRRKGLDGVWRTAYDAKANDSASIPQSMAYFPGIPASPLPAVLAIGIFNGQWTVLRSQDQGGHWAPVGGLWPEDGAVASAYGIACGPEGNIYVCGTRGRDGANRGWVLRVSRDGGNSWDTLLDQPSVSPGWAWSLGADAGGNVILTGCIVDPLDGTQRWTIVRNSPSQAWAESWAARSQPLGNIHSSGTAVLPGLGGTVFLGGRIHATDGITNQIGLLRTVP